MVRIALIAAGGAFGSVVRYLVQELGQKASHGAFPIGTLVVNLLGCFVAGVLNALFVGPFPIRADYRIGLVVGVVGGFTTFSAFGWETFALANDGQFLRATANVLANVLLGLGAVVAGARIAQHWFGAA
jgi:CrcB protein